MVKEVDFLKNIQDNLRRIMKERNITIKELEELSTVSEPTIKRLRTKPISPNTSIEVINNLAEALNISISELSRPMKPQNESDYDQESESYILNFNKETFSFPVGSKATFKKFDGNPNSITSYIVDKNLTLLKVIQNKPTLACGQNGKEHEINIDNIKWVISKIEYEV